MKKLFYVVISLLLLSGLNYTNGVDLRPVLRFHNGPLDRGTNTTDPVDHGRYVPYLFPEQEPQRTIFYYQGKKYPMYIAFTLIVSNGSYGYVINAG